MLSSDLTKMEEKQLQLATVAFAIAVICCKRKKKRKCQRIWARPWLHGRGRELEVSCVNTAIAYYCNLLLTMLMLCRGLGFLFPVF